MTAMQCPFRRNGLCSEQLMPSKLCALVLGLVYLFWGISGLIPRFVHLPQTEIRFYTDELNGHWGLVYSWLPANHLHSIVYIVLGAAGVLSFIALGLATRYCKAMFAITLLFVIAGFLPFGISSLWGLMPLFGYNIMLHTITAILAYYFGWIYPLDLGGPMSEVSEMPVPENN
jgi:hypothetical protein